MPSYTWLRPESWDDKDELNMKLRARRKTYTRIIPYRAGVFDFFDTIYRTDEENIYRPLMVKPGTNEPYSSYASWRTHQMSDHLPMWVELHIDFAQEYLDQIESEIQKNLQG